MGDSKEEFKEDIALLESEIEELEEKREELDARKEILEDNGNTDEYDDMLDETYGEVTIVGMGYSTSNVLKLVDETAYRCGMNDWNSEELDKVDNEIEVIEGEIKAMGEEIEELNGEIDDLEKEGVGSEKK